MHAQRRATGPDVSDEKCSQHHTQMVFIIICEGSRDHRVGFTARHASGGDSEIHAQRTAHMTIRKH